MESDTTIIIGSGAGGLSAAICLAREGKKVTVLEQHYIPGGWCHSFKLNGYKYTPGIHYIGLLGEGESTSELYKGLGIADDLLFFKMNAKAYEHCWIGEEKFDIPSDFDELISSLVKRFPHEEKGIKRYLKTVRDVSRQLQLIPKMNGFWDAVTIPWRTRYLGKYGLFSLKRVIDWHIKDPMLKKILNIQCGDHGLPPAKASFPLHSAVMEHYFKGGYYPMGGGSSIVKAMVKTLKSYGGEVRTKQMVKRILLDENSQEKKAIGVELQSGERLYADTIVSNADPEKTYIDLVGREHLSEKLLEKLDTTKYSCTSLMLFLTVDMDVKAAGLDSGNIWITPDRDMDDVYSDMMNPDLLSEDYFTGLFISCTTLKDPTSFDGKNHVLEVITYINYEAFEKFKDEDKERSEEYIEFKNALTDKMLNSLNRVIPGIKERVVHKELATPITNEHYINATNGNVYGTDKNLKQIGPFAFRPQSEIQNLYLCGASILSHGVAGASFSGIDTAARILGTRQEELLKHDATQTLRVYDAEDSSDYPEWIREITVEI